MSPPTTDRAAGGQTPGGRPPFRRRQFIVDPALQYGLIGRAMIHTLLVLTMVSVGLFGPVLLDLQAPRHLGDDADTAIVMLYMHGRFWWLAALCLAVAAADAVLVSHRIAGPLVPMKRMLQALGRGLLPGPLRTRARDFLKPEVEILNAAVAGLAQRIDALQRAHAEMVADVRRCSEAFAGSDSAAARASLDVVQQQARAVGELLAAFAPISARETSPAGAGAAAAVPHPV